MNEREYDWARVEPEEQMEFWVTRDDHEARVRNMYWGGCVVGAIGMLILCLLIGAITY